MTTHEVSPRSVLEQDRLESRLRALFEQRITFNEVLGLKVDSLAPESVRIGFEMRSELVGHYQHGRLHGGVISATLDATAGLALMVAIAHKHPGDSADQIMARFTRIGTIDLRVDFLRQGIGKRFQASATVTRLGGRVGSVQMRLENDEGVLVATGAAAYVLT